MEFSTFLDLFKWISSIFIGIFNFFKKKESGEKKRENDLRQYQEYIIDKFQYLDFSGLNAIMQKRIPLEKIYIKLRTHSYPDGETVRYSEDIPQMSQKNEKPKEIIKIISGIRKNKFVLKKPLRMFIMGLPGSGKTTLMKWIALKTAQHDMSDLDDLIPVFIALKDLGKDPDGTFRHSNIRELTLKLFKSVNISKSFFDHHFEGNKVLFLLDGLDEIAKAEIRKDVIQWIDNQNIKGNSLIVTSRYSGIQAEKGINFTDAFPVYKIAKFSPEDINDFLKNWYRNVEFAVEGNSETKDRESADIKYKALLKTIHNEQYKKLLELAENPLLLTIIAIVHRTRAVLPKERHRLYEECVKVMIELWNVANKKLNLSFSVENSIDCLSKIAVYLMKKERRETDLKSIEVMMPDDIESHSFTEFLEEMVLKSGLLFNSLGQYGFLHLTFQEYLTAWNFAHRENPEEILEYRDKDYWTETFKLFCNISNTRNFFKRILMNFETEKYWQQMPLWEECLKDIAIESTKKELELKFAKFILKLFANLDNSKAAEEIIDNCFTHYPIYNYAEILTDEAWDLFSNQKNPFVQAVGITILNLSNSLSEREFIKSISTKSIPREKHYTKDKNQHEDFEIASHVKYLMLLLNRNKLSDFQILLNNLRETSSKIVFFSLITLRYLLDILDHHYIQDLLDKPRNQRLHFLWYLKELLDRRDLRDLLNLLGITYHNFLQYLPHHLELKEPRHILSLRFLKYLRFLMKEFSPEIKSKIESNKDQITLWADQASAQLHGLTNENLLDYFPETTEEELRKFRESRCDI